jgi:hypothetical protein
MLQVISFFLSASYFFLQTCNFKQTVQSSHQGMGHGFGHAYTAN